MAKHEFGIMEKTPLSGERYDDYEPQKYNCISIHDDHIEPILEKFNDIDLYFHTVDVKGKGLCYAGITLIPPSSINAFIQVIKQGDIALLPLKELLEEALRRDRFVIHFGI